MTTQAYERTGVLSLDEVFPHIEEHFNKDGKYRINIREHSVKVLSLRLRTFLKKGIQCPCCQTTASFFAVERSKGSLGGYHLNLYGYDADGSEVLFTHDHILARSLGGEDNLENSRTMCGPCNWAKGEIERQLLKPLSREEIDAIYEQLKKYLPQ